MVHSVGKIDTVEWAKVSIYFEFPPNEQEIDSILKEFKERLASDAEKRFALHALEKLVHADGVVTDEEKELYAAIAEKINDVEQGFFVAFIELLKKILANCIGET